jgi:hypothetical protein
MNEKDLEQIEKLLTRKLDEQSKGFDQKLEMVSAAFDEKLTSKITVLSASVDLKLDAFSEILSKEFGTGLEESERRMENLLIVLEKKVDLVIEGQQALVERIDRMDLVQTKYDHNVDRRISNVAADLSTHKADPDAHRRGYSIKEGEESFGYPEPEREV